MVPSGAGTHAASGISEASFGMTIAASTAGVASGGASSGTHAASDCTTTCIYRKLLHLMLNCIYADVLTINDDVC